MLEVTQAGEQFFLVTRARIEQGAVYSSFDSPAGPNHESRLTPCPTGLAESIRRRAPALDETDAEGQYIRWLPLWLNDRIPCCIRLTYPAACEAHAQLLIKGIVTVYSNHLNLIDYSERDSLTGLLNRKTFDARFARMPAQRVASGHRALPGQPERRRSEEALDSWLTVIDIDHFKMINDRFGHLYGDEVLILLANILRSSFRSSEQIFRFGGEEFVVLLRSATLANATMVFERFRQAIEMHEFPQVGRVTASLGFVSISDDTPVVVLGRADQALYYAKAHGRNQIQLYARLVADNLLHQQAASSVVEFF
ncbi:MAG: GGDEF domain-containing protein [Noviherbaspirillum sp.]